MPKAVETPSVPKSRSTTAASPARRLAVPPRPSVAAIQTPSRRLLRSLAPIVIRSQYRVQRNFEILSIGKCDTRFRGLNGAQAYRDVPGCGRGAFVQPGRSKVRLRPVKRECAGERPRATIGGAAL